MKQAIIFDFDGVIIDSEPIRYETYRQLFRDEYSIGLPEKMDDELLGRSQRETLNHFLIKYGLKGDVEELISKRKKALDKKFSKKENIKIMPGLLKLLGVLKKVGFKIAIASSSNKEYIEYILNATKLSGFFEVIVAGDMVSKGKPNPEIFILTAEKLNKNRENCIVIEDSVNGIIAAKAAGMKVIAITSSFNKEQLIKADVIIDRLDEINVLDI